jgi:L-rhamnose 1-dehydrogenase
MTHRKAYVGIEGKVAIVTGSSRGIGRATAIRLANEGAAVVINHPGNDEDAAKGAAAEIAAQGGRAAIVEADVSDSKQVERMIERTLSELGPPQILINNAGICPMHDFLDMPEELWDKVHAVNLKGAFLCSQAVARCLVERNLPGRFVFVSSVSAWVGGAAQTHYTPTKAGISSLMRSLAVALGPKMIQCNAVLPGAILTDINRELLAPGSELLAKFEPRLPLKRIGQPEDIAGVIAFLCSDDARYMTGSEVLVDGGMFVNLQ